MPQEKNKTLRRRLDRWEAQGEHQQIADAVLALPPEKREDWLLLRPQDAFPDAERVKQRPQTQGENITCGP